MTKQLKKGLITVLLFVMAIVVAFSASNLFTAKADDKAAAFVTNATAFVEVADANDDGVLANDEIRAVMGTSADINFLAMYNFINNDAIGDLSSVAGYTVAKANYDKILAQYNLNGAVDLYSKLVTRAYVIHATNQASYTNNEEVVAMRTAFTTIYNSTDTKDLEFLHKSDLVWVNGKIEVGGVMTDAEIPEDLSKAESKMNGFRVAIEDAIAAVQAIKIYDEAVNASQMIPVWDGAAYRTFGKDNVVFDSKTSKEAARTAVDAVIANKDVAFIDGTKTFDGVKLNSVKVLTDVEKYWNLQEAKIKAVEKEINDLYEKEYSATPGAEVCYTIGTKIDTAETNYSKLSVAQFNNLKAQVSSTVVDRLDEMTNALSNIKTEISAVEGLIALIGNVVYTEDSKGLIDDARKDFELLDNDVKVNDNKKYDDEDATMTYAVDNYDLLKKAEAKWDSLVTEIKELVKAIDALRGIETTEPKDIYSAFNRVQNGDDTLVGYNQLADKDNQLNGGAAGDNLLGVNASAITAFTPEGYTAAIANAKDAYAYYRNLSNAITTATKPIIENIEKLNNLYNGEARFTSEFDSLYKEIVSAISSAPVTGADGKIDPRYQGAINNFDKYEALKDKYEKLLTLADNWVVAVKEIGEVCVSKFGEIKDAKDAYAKLTAKYPVDTAVPATWTLDSDIDNFNRCYAEETKTYANYYDIYTSALAVEEQIIKDLNAVKKAAIELVRPDLGGDYATYATAVANVTSLYNALASRDVTTGETQKYFQENEVYKDAYVAYTTALVYVEANAVEAAIAKILDNKNDNVNYIALARTAFDAASDAAKVDGIVRNYKVLTDAETAIKDWIDNVNKLLIDAKFDGEEDAVASDVKASLVIDKANVAEGFYRLNVTLATGYAEKWSNNVLTNVDKAYVSGEYNAATTYQLVCDMLRVAGADATGLSTKLTFIDAMLKDFVESYDANTTPLLDYNTLEGWVIALEDTQRALIKVNVGKFEQIASDKAMADQLATAIETLYNSKEITSDSVVQYYIISTIYEGLNGSQKALVVIDVEGGDVVKALATIKANLTPVDYDFATIVARIETLEGTYSDAKINELIATAKQTAIDDAKGYVDAEILKLKGALEAKDGELAAEIIKEIARVEKAFADADLALADEIAEDIADCLAAAKKYADDEIDKVEKLISDLETALKAADTKLAEDLAKEIEDRANAITALETALKAADAKLAEDLAAAKTELEGKLAAAQKALEDALKAEEDARKAEDAAIKADLEAAVASLNSTITTITIILSVVCAGLAACVVLLFLKKRA